MTSTGCGAFAGAGATPDLPSLVWTPRGWSHREHKTRPAGLRSCLRNFSVRMHILGGTEHRGGIDSFFFPLYSECNSK